MLLYRGWGFLALFIPAITMLIGIYFFGVSGNISYDIMLYSILAAAPITFALGLWLNKKKVHNLYFIKLQYWGLIWGVVAIGMIVFKYLKP
ncbi:hypothetical protein AQ505_13160 [Pedobacter sp. PACM 27299]|uniref:hypothetical protein n=1 Tax=Pedobacter sp. PACM 27299 TaxID=1727164 RepID=UPI000706E13C|nr:hypothetical protein [Pedobacter sp. PACM 27299]ALL06363.1 hypothetical protein AQ505_13160 [Pedobacter sp. PACM 27299]